MGKCILTEILQGTHTTSEILTWYPNNADHGTIMIKNILSSELILFHTFEKNIINSVFLSAQNNSILQHQKMRPQH